MMWVVLKYINVIWQQNVSIAIGPIWQYQQIKEKYCTEKMRFLINESFVYANYHLDI